MKSYLEAVSIHKGKWHNCLSTGADGHAFSSPWFFPGSGAGGGAGFQSWSRICSQRPAHPLRTVNTQKAEVLSISFANSENLSYTFPPRDLAYFLRLKGSILIFFFLTKEGQVCQLLLILVISIYISVKLAAWAFRLASLN